MADVAKQRGQNFYIGQESQVAQFIKKWQPPYKYMEPKYKSLCADLQYTLQKVFPGCKVHRFGSTITDLYFTDSDVDIFVELAAKNPNLNAKKIIRKSKTLLYNYRNIFGEIIAIPNARTPICKFLHIPTKIHCDFNFKSVIGVYNSWFIRYFLSLDNRLAHLMMVIKYWAKVQGLVSTLDFSKYSFAILFIFYLQHVYSLPPVIKLQTVNCINVQENWNVGMDYSFHFTSQSLSESTAEDILFGFFDYYACFNYDLDIICPFLGHPITKHDFLQFDTLEQLFQVYKVNLANMPPLQVKSEICIQDPFEHVNNVTARVKNACFKKFIALCKDACQILERRPVRDSALEELFERRHIPDNTLKRKNQRNIIHKVQQMLGLTRKLTKSRKKRNRKNKRMLLKPVS